jgi:hypothetical protein
MVPSFIDGVAELAVDATQQWSRSPNSCDESGEPREPPDHTMASYRFPLDHIAHSDC